MDGVYDVTESQGAPAVIVETDQSDCGRIKEAVKPVFLSACFVSWVGTLAMLYVSPLAAGVLAGVALVITTLAMILFCSDEVFLARVGINAP
jgi:hypothetical protein